MGLRRSALVGGILGVLCSSLVVLPHGAAADDRDQVLFRFEGEAAAEDWTPVKLPEIETA